jgi:hypothetical protein
MQPGKIPAAEPADYERAFEGLDFPVAKTAVLRHAHDHGGIDTEVIDTLGRLRQDEYETLDELRADLRALYIEAGYDETKLPV